MDEYDELLEKLSLASFNPIEKEQSKAHLSSLLAMADSDGNLDPKEIKFIEQIGIQLGLSQDDLNEIVQNPYPPLPPPNSWDRLKHLTEISLLMYIDGHVDPREMKVFHVIAKKYGLKKESKVNYLASIVFQYLKEGRITSNDYDELIERLYKELKNSFKL